MSVKHVQFALDGVPGLNAGQRLTLVSLGEWANDEGICWPSHDTIARRVGVSRRQVIRIIEQLEEKGIVVRVERKQHSNVYQLRCDIAMSHVTSRADVADVTPMTHQDVTSSAPDVTSSTSRCDIAMSPEPLEPPIEPPIEPPVIAHAKKACQLPDGYGPPVELVQWAVRDLGLASGDVWMETDKFRDYHLSKGSLFKDWNAAWRNWMRKAVEYGAQRRTVPAGNGGQVLSEFDELRLEYGIPIKGNGAIETKGVVMR